MPRFSAVFCLVASLALGACQAGGPKEGLGTVLGGVAGAALGSQIGAGDGQLVAVAAGTLIGSMIGREIGSSLDKADKAAMQQAGQAALERSPTGRATSWNNPDSGNSGSITPVRTYETTAGPCREFHNEVFIGGKRQQAYGTACRQADGSWKITKPAV